MADHPFNALAAARHPFTESFQLEGGGDLTLTKFPDDDVVRLALEKDGVRNSWPLTSSDLAQLRAATGALVVFNATEVLRAPRSA